MYRGECSLYHVNFHVKLSVLYLGVFTYTASTNTAQQCKKCDNDGVIETRRAGLLTNLLSNSISRICIINLRPASLSF